jgi:hypothetical protein
MHRIRVFVRLLTAKYEDRETPTPDGVPLDDLCANQSRGDHAEIPTIVSKWRRLEELDPDSQEYQDFLTSLLDDQLDRKVTTSLGGEDAITVLDVLARVRIYSFISADYKTTPILSVLILRPSVGSRSWSKPRKSFKPYPCSVAKPRVQCSSGSKPLQGRSKCGL